MTNQPNFLICGAMKSGTTSLYIYLRKHPQIFMPTKKEIHYFEYDKNYSKGNKWYKRYFKNAKKKCLGEATPGYMNFKKVPKRIYNFDKNIKIIFVMRNPVDRAYSHYNFSKLKGKEKFSFEEALKEEEKRLKVKNYKNNIYFSYKQKGRYSEHIKNYLKYFKKKKILFLIFEKMKKNPEKTLKKTFKFLRVKPDFKPEIKEYHKGGVSRVPFLYQFFDKIYTKMNKINPNLMKKLREYEIIYFFKKLMLDRYQEMKKETIKELEEYFKKYNKELEKIIGEKIPEWK